MPASIVGAQIRAAAVQMPPIGTMERGGTLLPCRGLSPVPPYQRAFCTKGTTCTASCILPTSVVGLCFGVTARH